LKISLSLLLLLYLALFFFLIQEFFHLLVKFDFLKLQGSDNLGECLQRRAVTHLLGLSSSPSSVGVSEGISFVASGVGGGVGGGAERQMPHFLYPEAPSLAEAMRHFLGQRTMRWQLDALYPGLVMRVGPMGAGYHDSGMLEFVLERIYDDTDRALGPGTNT